MISNSYYCQEIHGPYELHDIGDLHLEEGGTIRDCKLAFATFGSLDADTSNAILVPTWYSGTNKIMEQVYHRQGPRARSGQVFHHRHQPDRQRPVELAAQHSGAGAAMANFPRVRIGDDVRAQHKLLTEKFGLKVSRSSSAARWRRSRPTNGRCAIPRW